MNKENYEKKYKEVKQELRELEFKYNKLKERYHSQNAELILLKIELSGINENKNHHVFNPENKRSKYLSGGQYE